MTEPDLDTLARNYIWSRHAWSEAWSELDDKRRWDALVKFAVGCTMHPYDVARLVNTVATEEG